MFDFWVADENFISFIYQSYYNEEKSTYYGQFFPLLWVHVDLYNFSWFSKKKFLTSFSKNYAISKEMHEKGRRRAYVSPRWCSSMCSKFEIEPFSDFQLMPFYIDRQTDRSTDRQLYVFIYILAVLSGFTRVEIEML